MSISRKISSVLFGMAVAGIALVSVVHFTDACRLETVIYNGSAVDNWAKKFGLRQDKAVFEQPLDSLTHALLARDDIFKVDITYHLPNEIDIITNKFEPVGFVLDNQSGVLYGLDNNARLLPLENADIDWEQPVFVGVRIGQLFTVCKDERVMVTLNQLQELRRERVDLFRLLNEIDFSNSHYLVAYIDGLPFELRVRAERLRDDLDRFAEFIEHYNPDLSHVTRFDLRYDDMIICARGDA